MQSKKVTIFGTSKAKSGEPMFELAFELGSELAGMGCTIVNGGYGGIMLASARGASEKGAETIGVTCQAFGRAGPNQYISKEIPTQNLDERLEKLIELGDAYVILPGGTGTLLELAMVWELKNKGFVNLSKPIILLGDFWNPLVNVIKADDLESGTCLQLVVSVSDIVKVLGRYF